MTGQKDTWTRGPIYPVAHCTRCGVDLDVKDVASGFCWRCGYLGGVEFKEVTPERAVRDRGHHQ